LPAAASVGLFLPSLGTPPDDALDDGFVAPVGATGEPNDPIGFDDGCGPRSRDCGGKSSRAMRWAFKVGCEGRRIRRTTINANRGHGGRL